MAERDQMTQEEVDDVGKGMGLSFGIMALVIGCFNLAFIIPSLIYSYQGSSCVTTMAEGFSFPLSTWLQVDAYTRVGIVALFLLVAIVSCISTASGVKLAILSVCLLMIYSLFSLAWTIVGSVLFWGKLNPAGVCSGGVQSYMYALLIITYVGTCCNCLYSLKSRNNSDS